MDAIVNRPALEDFNRFCHSFDVRAVISAADEQGRAEGFEKEVYALAIMRAVHNGALGEDREATSKAISILWHDGYLKGFSEETFNEMFQELFVYW